VNRTNQILFVSLVVQAVLITATTFGRSKEGPVAKATKVFEGFEPEKVTKIKIAGDLGVNLDKKEPQKTVLLDKQGTSWGLADADHYPADQSKVDTFLKNVQKLMARGAVVCKKSYFPKLEVADDKYQRLVTLTQDGKEIGFYIGSSPSFKHVHLRKLGSEDVVLVDGLSVWDVGAGATDWVDRNYLKIPENDVWAITLENKNGAIRMEKAPDGTWAATGLGPNEKLKKSSVDDVVRKVSSIALEEAHGKAEKPEYGLDAPLVKIQLVTGSSTIAGQPPKSTDIKAIKIGKKAADQNRYFVKASSSEYVVEAPGWSVEPLLTKTTKDLLDEPAKKDDKKPAAPAPKKPH
jgi:hypothetical protein